jgi:protein-S-isoprenylcysteine O-methyltransferase Ste14
MDGEFRFQFMRALQLGAALLILVMTIAYNGAWNRTRVAGLVLAIPSLIPLFIARFQLGRSFAVTPQAKQLVTHGLYSKIRHPMYVFSFLLVLGFFVTLQRPVLLIVPALLLIVQITRACQEAKVLEEKFGEQYRAYRAKTWF